MVHEQLEFDKAPAPPFADSSGQQRYRLSIRDKLDGLWNTMFPKSRIVTDEDMKRIETFKARKVRERKEGPVGPWWRPWKDG